MECEIYFIFVETIKKNIMAITIKTNQDFWSYLKNDTSLLKSITDFEQPIQLDVFRVELTSAKTAIMRAERGLDLGGKSIGNLITEVTFQDFKALYTLAKNLYIANPNKSELSALSISWGATEANEIELIYQPVMLTKVGSRYNENHNIINDYNIRSQGDYCEKNGKKIADKLREKLQKNYQEKIQFIEGKDRFFINSHDDNLKGDVKSMLYTFQEIFAILFFNEEGNIRIDNCIREIKDISDPNNLIIKHSTLLSPIDIGVFLYNILKVSFNIDFTNILGGDIKLRQEKLVADIIPLLQDSYANLAHLCPPRCSNGFSYLME